MTFHLGLFSSLCLSNSFVNGSLELHHVGTTDFLSPSLLNSKRVAPARLMPNPRSVFQINSISHIFGSFWLRNRLKSSSWHYPIYTHMNFNLILPLISRPDRLTSVIQHNYCVCYLFGCSLLCYSLPTRKSGATNCKCNWVGQTLILLLLWGNIQVSI